MIPWVCPFPPQTGCRTQFMKGPVGRWADVEKGLYGCHKLSLSKFGFIFSMNENYDSSSCLITIPNMRVLKYSPFLNIYLLLMNMNVWVFFRNFNRGRKVDRLKWGTRRSRGLTQIWHQRLKMPPRSRTSSCHSVFIYHIFIYLFVLSLGHSLIHWSIYLSIQTIIYSFIHFFYLQRLFWKLQITHS